jgi:hypothetical protein
MIKRWIAGAITGTMVLAGSLAGVAAAPGASAASASSCPGGHYPGAVVGGRPTAAKAGHTGLALWQDHFGWHLRVSHAGHGPVVFTGQILTDGQIKDVTRRTEGGDLVVNYGSHHTLYRFVNYGAVDGLDFVLPCSSYVRFAVSLNHKALPTSDIVIGAGNHHPATNGFTISKTS